MKKIVNMLLILVLLIPSIIVPDIKVKAKTLGDVEKELAKYEEDYRQNKLNVAKTEEEIKNTKNKIQVANDEIIASNNQIIALNKEIEQLNEEILKKDKEIKEIMNFFQKSNGESAFLEYTFGAQDFTDFIYRTAISEQLTNYNKKLIDEHNEKIEQNKNKTKQLDERKVELNNKQKELEKLLTSLGTALEEYEEDRIDIEEEIRMKKDAIQMYRDMGCESGDDLDVCTAKKLPADTQLFRPLKVGKVSQEFGKPDSITSGFYSIHGGIDLTTVDNNTPVYSSGNGLVVAVSRNQSCGNNIVYIQHKISEGKNKYSYYTTSYWHLRRVFVKEGDKVTKDTQIGIMGGAASDHDRCALGAHVHFVVATGLYLQDYYYLSTFNARRINPRTVVNFPAKWVEFKDRYIKY